MAAEVSEIKQREKEEPLKISALVRFFFFSLDILGKIFSFIRACFSGFWLGVLNRERLHQLNVACFERTLCYSQNEYNRQGLFPWEKEAVDRYFKNCKTILVGAAGGGREMIGLHRRGFQPSGFECSARFVAQANALLQKENIPAQVQLAPPDEGPAPVQKYDGIFLGWQVYSLIAGRKNRVSFLRQLSSQIAAAGPLFLSFNFRNGKGLSFRLAKGIANAIRFVARKSPVEEGDIINLYFEHHFTKTEIETELKEGGFQPVCFNTDDFAYAVALREGFGE